MKKTIFLYCSFLVFLFSLVVTAPAEKITDPAALVIEKLNTVLVECMQRSDELGYGGRYRLLEPVMKKSFYYSLMVRKSTGSFWKDMTEEQQKELLEKYITWSIATYADRFSTYKSQQFIVVSTEPVHKKYRRVIVHIVKKNKKKRILEYLLIEDKATGAWRIIDIRVKGVSQLALTRAQFKSILKKQGVGGLLKLLDKKIKKVTPPSVTGE